MTDARRIDYRNGHRYTLGGEKVDGVTTILDKGVPKPALVNWAANVTAEYVTDHWDELLEMKTSEREKVLKRVRWEQKDAAARRGTEVHEYAHRLAQGEPVNVPEELRGHVDSYLDFARDWEPQELVVEAWIVNRTHRYMGTLDTIAQLVDGKVWMLDWKTGGKGVYPETALQLAAYANAETLVQNGEETPMPKVDAAGAVWLRADGYDLVPVRIDEEVFMAFLYAQQVARFTAELSELVLGESLQPPEVSAA